MLGLRKRHHHGTIVSPCHANFTPEDIPKFLKGFSSFLGLPKSTTESCFDSIYLLMAL